MYFLATISVSFKKSILEPQGQAVKIALKEKYEQTSDLTNSIKNIRIGKIIEVRVQASSEKKAKEYLEKLTSDFLYNPVMETYSISLKEDS